MSRADAGEARYEREFIQVPGVIIAERLPRLGANGLALLNLALYLAGRQGLRADGVYRVELASRYIKGALGWEYTRQRKAKESLVSALPEVFELVPGSATTNTGDTLIFRQHRLAALHRQYLLSKQQHPAVETTAGLLSKQEQACYQNDSKDKRQEISREEEIMSASADRAESGDNAAKTEKVGSGNLTVVSAKKTTTRKAADVSDLLPFLAAWNENRNPDRMSQHRGLDRDQADLLRQMITGHAGDVEAALESWTLAVRKLAAVDTRQASNWWGDPSQPRRSITNAARHWSKHAVAFTDVSAKPRFDALPTFDGPEEF